MHRYREWNDDHSTIWIVGVAATGTSENVDVLITNSLKVPVTGQEQGGRLGSGQAHVLSSNGF